MATWVSSGSSRSRSSIRLARVGIIRQAVTPCSSSSSKRAAGLAERRDRTHRLAGELAQRLALGIVARIEVHVRPGRRDHLERRVGDELGQHVAHDELLAPAQLDETEEVAVRLRQVAGERILGLVQMVVGVEDRKS